MCIRDRFGATYMVISPEHAFIKKWVNAGLIKNADAVAAYQEDCLLYTSRCV